MEVNKGQGLGKMAGNPVASFDFAKGWNFPLAVFHTDGTSRMEIAAGWKGNRAGNLSSEDNPLPRGFHDRVRNRYGRKECYGIGMFGHTVKGISIRHFNNLSEVHDCNPVADVADYREIMGDKEVGEIKLSLKVFGKA
jgi:hypothetical protein